MKYVIYNKTRGQFWNQWKKKWDYYCPDTTLYSHDEIEVMSTERQFPYPDPKTDIVLAIPTLTFFNGTHPQVRNKKDKFSSLFDESQTDDGEYD